MSPTTSRREPRRTLASLAIIGALFISGSSVAGCQNETAAPPRGPQFSPEVSTTSGSPSPDQISASAPTPMPGPASLAATPPAVVIPAPAASRTAPSPTPRETPAPHAAAVTPSPASIHESDSCDADYYRNSDGNCVHRPQHTATAPTGATARCTDGTYSFSQHRRGTCSGHGGVAQWL
jgi:hypothetical protein